MGAIRDQKIAGRRMVAPRALRAARVQTNCRNGRVPIDHGVRPLNMETHA